MTQLLLWFIQPRIKFVSVLKLVSSALTSCCQKCSCSIDCTLAGNCCPDVKLPNDSDLSQGPPCQGISSILNDKRLNVSYATTGFDDQLFRFIDHCRTKRSVPESTRALCDQGGESLSDYVPVSTPSGDKLFKNRHCAACHGFFNTVDWKLYILSDCIPLLSQSFANQAERETAILETCILYSKPPSNLLGEMVSCYTDPISRCNHTFQWDAYDSELESKCINSQPFSFNSLYRHEHFGLYMFFRNSFCYQCNIKTDSKDNGDTCEVTDFVGMKSITHSSFTILLSTEHVVNNNQVCAETEVFDPVIVSIKHQFKCLVKFKLT